MSERKLMHEFVAIRALQELRKKENGELLSALLARKSATFAEIEAWSGAAPEDFLREPEVFDYQEDVREWLRWEATRNKIQQAGAERQIRQAADEARAAALDGARERFKVEKEAYGRQSAFWGMFAGAFVMYLIMTI